MAPSSPSSASPANTPSEVLATQELALPVPSKASRLRRLFPPGQFLRYLAVGLWNTLFGFATYALFVSLLAHLLPTRWLALNALVASLLSTPINITMAFLGYKFFVFRTRGNFLAEWLRCFAVYGASMIPGLLALSALTRLFQSLLTSHPAFARHLPTIAQGKNLAAYLAGALLMAFTTVFSFLGHKTFSFKAPTIDTTPKNA